MSPLIYRGVTHHGDKTHRPRVAQDLIYRGVPHDGLTAQAAPPLRDVEMAYRGVAYFLTPSGIRLDDTPATFADGLVVPASA